MRANASPQPLRAGINRRRNPLFVVVPDPAGINPGGSLARALLDLIPQGTSSTRDHPEHDDDHPDGTDVLGRDSHLGCNLAAALHSDTTPRHNAWGS